MRRPQPPAPTSTYPRELSTLRSVRAQPPGRCTPAQLLLFALLAFQLALGLQQSAGAPHPDTAHYSAHGAMSMSASNDGACPLHTPTPDDKHDCCKSSGCQCQCGSVSLAVNLDAPKGIPASTQVQPVTTVRFPTAPPDTLFRPPIRD